MFQTEPAQYVKSCLIHWPGRFARLARLARYARGFRAASGFALGSNFAGRLLHGIAASWSLHGESQNLNLK